MACSAIGNLVAGTPELSAALLLEFANFLPKVAEDLHLLKISDSEIKLDSQVPFLPSVEVLVTALFVISVGVVATAPTVSNFTLMILCSHHPSLVGTAKRDNIWRADSNTDVWRGMVNVGVTIINKHGRESFSLLFAIFKNYFDKKASDDKKYDLVHEGVIILFVALAEHLAKDDPNIKFVLDKLLDALNTSSEAVQRAVYTCLSSLLQSKQALKSFKHLLDLN